MLNNVIGRIVDYCTRYAWGVAVFAALLAVAAGAFTVRNFAINTDITRLISPDLPWRQRELAFFSAFPQARERILVVLEAPTPELTSAAAKALVGRLAPREDLFHSVRDTGDGQFFERNGLLFVPTGDLAATMRQLAQAGPVIGSLASDPSLRGLAQGLTIGLMGARRDPAGLNNMTRSLTAVTTTWDDVLANRPTNFSWQVLLKGKPAEPNELRRFIDIWPVLDYGALEPGGKPTQAVRDAMRDLKLSSEYGARARLTGPVPIADEEFGTLRENAVMNNVITVAVVLFLLWMALRSKRVIFAVSLSLFASLVITSALGLMLVEALNPISVAFAVLCVGLGVDFGIQYSVRYRAERFEKPNLRQALVGAGRGVGAQLTLAAAAVTCGFFSFLPTAYRGLSELGLIAGLGMVIAFITSITLLPALIALFNPPGEPERLGFFWLAPVDRFLERFRIPVVVATLVVVLAGLPFLFKISFDFNPLNLRNPHTESIATYLDLRRDPKTNTNTAQVLADSVEEARAIAEKLRNVPQVGDVVTLESFVPGAQQEKLALIRNAAKTLGPALNPSSARPAPNDAEKVRILSSMATNLNRVAGEDSGEGASAARKLADTLTRLAAADEATRTRAEAALVRPLVISLNYLRQALHAQTVTLDNLPADLVRDWMSPDKRLRIQIGMKGDASDTDQLRTFARAVLAAEPQATGEAVGYYESGETVVRAFIEAGLWALLLIAILLWIVLRRLGDVLLTLVPLLVAGAITLEICALIGLQLNFANIIALPLLLGVGVAFKIYYVMAWRAGQTNLLQTSLTRAVIYSAATTATAFGSLWLSSHPGTSSMGELMALALATTMTAAVLFQPALMGPPRAKAHEKELEKPKPQTKSRVRAEAA
jgi:hopanoid biosynthesis associated RND transporter like protein HpnN